MLASVSQHQRQKNKEQVVNRMKARLMNGYFALEGFATGRFETQAEVKRFLEQHTIFKRDLNGEIHPQRIKKLLTNLIYAGYYKYEPWGVPLTKGKHCSEWCMRLPCHTAGIRDPNRRNHQSLHGIRSTSQQQK